MWLRVNTSASTFATWMYRFAYARWVGYISFPLSTTFDLEMTGIEGKCKLLIGETLIFDTDKASITGSFNAYEHLLYEIQIEYSTVRFLSMKCTFTFQPNLTPLACIFLYRISIACCCNYFGHRSKQGVIQNLFSSLAPIRGSPFNLTVI